MTGQDQIRPGYKQTKVGVIPEDWEVKPLPKALDFISGKAHEQHILPYGDFMVVNSKFISSEGQIAKYSDSNFCPARRGDILMVMSDLPNGKALAKCFLVKEDRRYAVNQRVCILRPRNADSRFFYYQLNRNPYFLAFDDGVQQTHLLNGVFRACPVITPPLPEQRAIAEALSDADGLIAALEALIAKKRDLKQAAMQQLLTGKTRLPGFSTVSGFASTVIGELPADWDVSRIVDVASITTGSKNTQDRLETGEYPFYVRSQTIERINSFSFDGEAVLTAGDGVGTGKVYHYINGKFDLHQRVYQISNFSKRLIGFFFFIYFSTHFYDRIMSMTAKSSVDSVRREMIADMLIPLPPPEEQIAIGEVLSDMDADLAALEAQRDKAKEIKQGMMQELLTGKVRLI